MTGGQKRLPVSVFIICFNEADRIGTSLASVCDWADDVVVVDSGSSDETTRIVSRFPARLFVHPFSGYGAQKRYGESLCRHRWVLNIDADETVTPALRSEITALFAETGSAPGTGAGTGARVPQGQGGTGASSGDIAPSSPGGCIGWQIACRDIFAHHGKVMPGAYRHYVLRLYDRTQCRFSDSPVHDSVIAPAGAKIGTLNGWLEHRSIRSLAHQVDKLNSYSSAQVREIVARKRKVNPLRLFLEFPVAFFRSYILHRNVIYGRWGFILAMNFAFSRFLRLAKFHETALGKTAARQNSVPAATKDGSAHQIHHLNHADSTSQQVD